MNTERILADAEIAATYLRALVANGVPIAAAVSLTGTYMSACQMVRANRDEPKEPWEDSGT